MLWKTESVCRFIITFLFVRFYVMLNIFCNWCSYGCPIFGWTVCETTMELELLQAFMAILEKQVITLLISTGGWTNLQNRIDEPFVWLEPGFSSLQFFTFVLYYLQLIYWYYQSTWVSLPIEKRRDSWVKWLCRSERFI